MLRAAGIALLAVIACGCGKTAASSAAPVSPQPAAAPAPPEPVADAVPRTLSNPLDIGSQDARDDLYCSGVIFYRYGPTADALTPTDEAIRMRNEGMGMVIAQHGADKLMAEGVARVTQLGEISDAYSDRTARDIAAGKPRIALDACMKRAEAVPKPAQ